MIEGNSHRPGFPICCITFTMMLLLPAQPSQASPHPYYDDLGLVSWRTNWSVALLEAQQSGKPLYIQITRFPCPVSPTFCRKSFPDAKLQKMLRRFSICFVADYQHLPSDIKQIVKAKGLGEDQCPIHLLIAPNKELIHWAMKNATPDVLARIVEQAGTDKRLRMSKAQDREVEKLALALQAVLHSRDTRKIQAAWQSIQKTPGWSEAKIKCYDIMDAVEEPARKKLLDAAQLAREQKIPQAQLALEEARVFAESLPIAIEIDQTIASLKLYDRALEIEQVTASTNQKQQIVSLYQQILTKYPENTIATLVFHKLREINLGK